MAGVFVAGACDAGNVDGEPPDPPDLESELPPDVACQAKLVVSGTLDMESPVPSEEEGCAPDGMWQITAQVEDMADCEEVPLLSSYAYQVTTSPESGVIEVAYLGDSTSDELYLKVSFEGGACSGNFEHHSSTGTEVLILRPFAEGEQISGVGMFERRTPSS